MGTTADHQLALISARSATDQRIGFEHADSFDNLTDASSRILNLKLREMIENPVEILPNLGGKFNARQRYFANLRAAGRLTTLPAKRSSR